MTRDNFSCKQCGRSALDGTILNVHHIKYKRGAKPWEYADEDLITLCEECHHATHEQKKSLDSIGVKIGDFITYSHSDYDNYGIVIHSVHGIDAALAAFADSGSGSHTIWFGDVIDGKVANRYNFNFLKEETIAKQTNALNVFISYVADYILNVSKGIPLKGYTFFCINDFPIEKVKERMDEYIHKNFAEMVKNNVQLKKYWGL